VNAEDGGFAQFVEVRQRALQRTAWLLTGAITPDGKTLYVGSDGPLRGAVIPISTATNTPGKPIRPAGYRGVPMLWISP
jgi:hypothetical protein